LKTERAQVVPRKSRSGFLLQSRFAQEFEEFSGGVVLRRSKLLQHAGFLERNLLDA
jgi:hypothetical protein